MKKIQELVDKFAFPFCGALKWERTYKRWKSWNGTRHNQAPNTQIELYQLDMFPQQSYNNEGFQWAHVWSFPAHVLGVNPQDLKKTATLISTWMITGIIPGTLIQIWTPSKYLSSMRYSTVLCGVLWLIYYSTKFVGIQREYIPYYYWCYVGRTSHISREH